jgi:hypothetical protein
VSVIIRSVRILLPLSPARCGVGAGMVREQKNDETPDLLDGLEREHDEALERVVNIG